MTVFIVVVEGVVPVSHVLLVIAQIKESQIFLLANEVNTAALKFVCAKMINVERRIYLAKRLRWEIAVVE